MNYFIVAIQTERFAIVDKRSCVAAAAAAGVGCAAPRPRRAHRVARTWRRAGAAAHRRTKLALNHCEMHRLGCFRETRRCRRRAILIPFVIAALPATDKRRRAPLGLGCGGAARFGATATAALRAAPPPPSSPNAGKCRLAANA